MSRPLSSAELREIICKLERLEVWQKQQETESKASGSQSKGYGRGDPKARAAALLSKTGPPPVPALEHIATRWKITEEEGPPFSGPAFTSIESGPGPLPPVVEDQADFVSWDQREGLQRVHLAFSAGFWGRASVETFTCQFPPFSPSEKDEHFICLRASGFSSPVRFEGKADLEAFRAQVFEGGLILFGFQTQVEIDVFCQGARIAVPPKIEQC